MDFFDLSKLLRIWDCRWFCVLKTLTGSRHLKNVLSVTKHGFVFWAQRKPNARLAIYNAFDSLDWLGFLDRSNLLKIPDCRSFSVLKTLTGYWPYSYSDSRKRKQGVSIRTQAVKLHKNYVHFKYSLRVNQKNSLGEYSYLDFDRLNWLISKRLCNETTGNR